MNDIPHYPWNEGDKLFASELNAAIANAMATSGGAGRNIIDVSEIMRGDPNSGMDATPAMQQALALAAITPGSVIYLCPGEWNFQAAVPAGASDGGTLGACFLIPSRTVIRGAGLAVTRMLWNDADETFNLFDAVQVTAGTPLTTDIAFEDFTIVGSWDRNLEGTGNGGYPLIIHNASAIRFHRVGSRFCRRNAIVTRYCYDIVCHECDIRYCAHGAIDHATCAMVIVSNNTIMHSDDNCIAVHSENFDSWGVRKNVIIVGNSIFDSVGIACIAPRSVLVAYNNLDCIRLVGITFHEYVPPTVGSNSAALGTVIANNNITNIINEWAFSGPPQIRNGNVGISLSGSSARAGNLPAIPGENVTNTTTVDGIVFPAGTIIDDTVYFGTNSTDPTVAVAISRGYTIIGNSVARTLPPCDGTATAVVGGTAKTYTKWSDYGFTDPVGNGRMFLKTGWVNPSLNVSQISGEGVRLGGGSIRDVLITNNEFRGLEKAVNFYLCQPKDVFVRSNLIVDCGTGFGAIVVDLSPTSGSPPVPDDPKLPARIYIEDNFIDVDPYQRHSNRLPRGQWNTNVRPQWPGAVWIQSGSGVVFRRNTVRNANVVVSNGPGGVTHVSDNWVEGFPAPTPNTPNAGIGVVPLDGTRLRHIESDPTSTHYGEIMSAPLDVSLSMPTTGLYLVGAYVTRTYTGPDANGAVLRGWVRLTTGDTHVAGVDWSPVYDYSTSNDLTALPVVGASSGVVSGIVVNPLPGAFQFAISDPWPGVAIDAPGSGGTQATAHVPTLLPEIPGTIDTTTMGSDHNLGLVPLIAAGGLSYVVGETLTATGGTFTTPFQGTVDSIGSAGGVQRFIVTQGGKYSAFPPNPTNFSGTAGAGFALHLQTWALGAPLIVDNGGHYPNGTPNAVLTFTNGDRGGRLTVKMGQSFVGSPTGLMLAGNATAPLQAVPLQQLTSATAGGPFLPLTGGTVGGATVFANVSYNLLASGAAGDGVTDDTPKIQAFLNALPFGCEVVLPAGSQFLIDSADLTLPPGITIKGQGGLTNTNMLSGPAFILNPLYTIHVNEGVHFSNFKILRKGLLGAPSQAQINAAVAQWAAEAIFLQTSAATASGNTLPFTNTSGVTVGMKAYGEHLQPHGTTVTAVVPNTSVTFAGVVNFPVPIGDYVRFGASIAVHLPPNLAAFTVERLRIMGFHTALLTEGGDVFVDTMEADCTTVMYVIHGGDASYITKVHCIPYYGNTSGAGTMRPGPAFLLCHADGWFFETCSVVGWAVGFVLHGVGGVTLQRCWREGTPDGTTVSTAFRTEGGIITGPTFLGCVATASICYDFQQTMGGVVSVGCTSAVGSGDPTVIAHYRLGPASTGQISSSELITGTSTPFVVQPGVGNWRIVSLEMFAAPNPWIVGAAADLAKISLISCAAMDGTTSTQVQTHVNERMWVTSNTSVATTDGSPSETFAVESSAAGAANTNLSSFWRNGTRLGYFSTGVSNGQLELHGDGINLGLFGNAITLGNPTTITGGVNFGSVLGSTNIDLANHIRLWSTTYGINVTSARLNYVTGGYVSPSGTVHKFIIGGSDAAH